MSDNNDFRYSNQSHNGENEAAFGEASEEAVSLEMTPAYQVSPVLPEEQLNYLLLNMRTAMQTRDSKLAALNICLIIDQSSSMRGDKLFAVKSAARNVVEQLTGADFFSLISFNDRPTTVVKCQRVSSRETIKSLIDGIEGRGGTEIAQGLFAGIQEMQYAATMTEMNYILLLTDGQTYGDADRCVQLGEEAARRNIVIYPMGIGTDWNEDLLEVVAGKSGGSTEYIESPEQIVQFFMQKINQLRGTLAPNSSLQFVPERGVKLRKFHRVLPSIAALEVVPLAHGGTENVEISLGPLARGSEYVYLMELVLPPLPPGTHKIADLGLTFAAAGTLDAQWMASLGVGFNFAATPQPPMVNPEVRQFIEKVTAFKLQAQAWQEIADGDVTAGKRRLTRVSTHLLNMGEIELAATVMDEVTNLEQRGTVSNEGKKRIKYGTRGLV